MTDHQRRASELTGRHQAVGGLADPAREHGFPQRGSFPWASNNTRIAAASTTSGNRWNSATQQQPPTGQGQCSEHADKPCETSTPVNSSAPADEQPDRNPGHGFPDERRARRRNTWRKPKYPNESFILDMRRHQGCIRGSVTYSKVRLHAPLTLRRGSDAVSKLVAVEEYQPAGRNLHRPGDTATPGCRVCSS